MAEKTIDPVHWDMMVDAIHDGTCVPFLGAGANYPVLPLAKAVATQLAAEVLSIPVDELEGLVKDIAAKLDELEAFEVNQQRPFSKYKDLLRVGLHDLARVALHLEVKGDYAHLVSRLEGIIADKDCAPSTLLDVLARMPLRLIVTTNYDRLMEKALENNKKRPPEVVVQRIKGFSAEEREHWQKRLATTKRLILYKIHGTFGEQDEPARDGNAPRRKRVIVSEEDYIEFLTVAAIRDEGVPSLISSKMVDGLLLFLGYGLEDWDFRMIYKALIERLPPRDARRAFAVQRNPSPGWEKFWAEKKVTIYDVDLDAFARELQTKCLEKKRSRT